jgi:hypothetical protein
MTDLSEISTFAIMQISVWSSLLLYFTSLRVTQLDDAGSFRLGDVADVRVPVVLGVMSRCPDAIICESIFNQVLKEVASIVDLSFTFLGTCVPPLSSQVL